MFLYRKKRNESKNNERFDITFEMEGRYIINTIAITNIVCVTDLSRHNYN